MKRNHVVLVALSVLVLSGSLLLRARVAANDTDSIRIWDNCDPATCNATFGPGTCLPGEHGTETFSIFVGELSADRIAGAWRFGSTGYTTLPQEIRRPSTIVTAGCTRLLRLPSSAEDSCRS